VEVVVCEVLLECVEVCVGVCLECGDVVASCMNGDVVSVLGDVCVWCGWDWYVVHV